MACSRQYVVEGTQPPADQTRLPNEGVIAQVVVVVAEQDVEDHTLEQLRVVRTNHTRMAVVAHCLRKVRIALRTRLGFVATHQRETADEPQTVLCPPMARLGCH